PPVTAAAHGGQARPHGAHGACDVQVHDVLPRLLVEVVELGEGIDAGVRREDVDPAELAGDAGGHRVDRGPTGDVGGNCSRALAELGCGRGGDLQIDVRDDDVSTLGREDGCDPASNAPRSAGDE